MKRNAAIFAGVALAALMTSGMAWAAARPAPSVALPPIPVISSLLPSTTVASTTLPTTTTTAPKPSGPGGGAATRPVATPPPVYDYHLNLAVPPSSTVARIVTDAPASATAGGPPVSKVLAKWYGYPSVLPVIATAPGWLEVREQERPNQSTAWIPAQYASLATTPYFLVLKLSAMHLFVFRDGHQIAAFPSGIGAPDAPTVTGAYFVTMTVPPPNAAYGPFVLATSAHSETIKSWEGMGDAIVGIHGPITGYDDARIGQTGAAISHGCIRLHTPDLAQLSVVPAGTPLDILP